jgi:hypothetical protein
MFDAGTDSVEKKVSTAVGVMEPAPVYEYEQVAEMMLAVKRIMMNNILQTLL